MNRATFNWYEWLRSLADGAVMTCAYYVQRGDEYRMQAEWAAARWELCDARARLLLVVTNEIVNAGGK